MRIAVSLPRVLGTQWVAPVDERKSGALAAQRRAINPHDHLNRPRSGCAAAFRFTVLGDAPQPIIHWPCIVRILRSRGRYRRGVHDSAFPRSLQLPGRSRKTDGARSQLRRAGSFAPKQLQSPIPNRFPERGCARKAGVHPASECKLGHDMIARDEPDVVLNPAAIGGADIASAPQDLGGAPQRVAEEHPHRDRIGVNREPSCPRRRRVRPACRMRGLLPLGR